jgi:hypothetical protein
MARGNGKSRHRGRSSSVGVGKVRSEHIRKVRSESPAGGDSNYSNQQLEKTAKVTELAGVDDTDALCGELEAMQFIINDAPSHAELVFNQAVTHNPRAPPKPSISLPSCSYVHQANGNIMSRDQFAAHLEAHAATLSKESRTQRLRRVLKRRLRASRSKIADLKLKTRQNTEKAILGHDLWHETRKIQIPACVRDDLDLLIQERQLAEYQQMLLSCRCPKEGPCRTPSTLTAWQVKLRDLYIERVFDFEKRQDMRRDQRSRHRGEPRSTRWEDACKKYADTFAGRRRS